ncbi:30S ribosomal protein S4e [Candidatus Micrarchaeota archaeon]|nr:30S ribosomal protein S4e [Candidatus Micrarchaeota archaeon]
MAKRGGTRHMKRLAAPKAMPITNKKETTWIVKPMPGPHGTKRCIPLGVLLRDILKVAKTLREAKRILYMRKALVDGKARVSEKFPVGLMDVISFPDANKHYRIIVDWKGRLVPMEIEGGKAATKILTVVNKHTAPGKKTMLTFHDGKNLAGDNHVKIGDSVIVNLPKADMVSHLRLQPGARCLISEGKHSGKIVTLKEILKRKGGKRPEVLVTDEGGEFLTVLNYLFVVGPDFEVKK